MYQNRAKYNQANSSIRTREGEDAIVFAHQPLQYGNLVPGHQQLRVLLPNDNPNLSPFPSISVNQAESLVRSALSQRTFEACLQIWEPSGDTRGLNNETRELVYILPQLSAQDEALYHVVLAMGTAALGQNTGDVNLTQEGKKMYGKALKETAVALRNPARAKSDAFLVVPRLMSVFEILFGAEPKTGAQAKGFLSHAVGETALIVSRGPEAYAKSDAAHMLFVNARFRTLIAALRNRKAAIFNQEDWKTLPWEGRVKTPNDLLLDMLCEISAILEEIDNISPRLPPSSATMTMSPRQRKKALSNTVARCWAVHLQLETWAANHANLIYMPLSPSINPNSTDPITFSDFETAFLTARYWVTGLLLYTALDDAIANLEKSKPNTPNPKLTTNINPPPSPPSTHYAARPSPATYARLITRSVQYFFQPAYGVASATVVSFALGIALMYFRNNMAANAEFVGPVMKAWRNPNGPSAVRSFLTSMRTATDEEERLGGKWRDLSPRVGVGGKGQGREMGKGEGGDDSWEGEKGGETCAV